jgi:malonyl-CoA O-methyltransferase
MPLTVDKQLLHRHFSLHATQYDAVTPIQDAMGSELLALLATLPPLPPDARILELGCGTGRLTERLADRYPGATLTALDLAPAMLEQARQRLGPRPRLSLLAADAEHLPAAVLAAAPYDLIISNAMLQWLHDAPAALARYQALLAPGGLLLCSTFGPDTFVELRTAFAAAERALGLPLRPHVVPMPSLAALAAPLTRPGRQVLTRTAYATARYATLRDFLRAIRLTGATLAARSAPVSRALYARLEAEYEARYRDAATGTLPVTYHQLFLAQRPAP